MLNPDLFPPTVAQGARQLTLPPLPVFPFPNFVDDAVGGHSSQGHFQDIELQDAPAVACAFDRKHIEQVFEYSLFTAIRDFFRCMIPFLQLLQRSDAVVRSELQATSSDASASINHAAATIAPHHNALLSPVNVAAAIGLSSPMSLHPSPAPAQPSLSIGAVSSSGLASSSLEHLAALPIENLQPQPHREFSSS